MVKKNRHDRKGKKDKMKYTVLYNPNAGNGTGATEAEKLRDILKGDEITFTDITKLGGT